VSLSGFDFGRCDGRHNTSVIQKRHPTTGGDGDGNPLELMLDGERPDPPPDREQKEAPSVCRGFKVVWGKRAAIYVRVSTDEQSVAP